MSLLSGVSGLLIFCVVMVQLNSDDDEHYSKDPGLIREVKPNFDAIKGLVCYQCKSVTSERQPLCDKSIFKLATHEEKYNMSLQCPHYQGAYCFTKITKKGKFTETIRGCSGSKDKNGNLMKTGCMLTKNVVLCLCDKKFCNSARNNFIQLSVFVLFITIKVLM